MIKLTHKWQKAMQQAWVRTNLMALLVSVIAIAGLSTAYAAMSTTLFIGGQATVVDGGSVRIGHVQASASQPSCSTVTYPPTWGRLSFQLDGALAALDCELSFDVEVKNDTGNAIYIKQIIEDSFNNATNMEYAFSITPSTAQSVVAANSSKTFQLVFRYKPSVASLPAITSFMASFHLVVDVVTPPVIAVSNSSRNFEIFRGETSFTPANLHSRVSALDDIDGDITGQITRTCRKGGSTVACPTAWLAWDAGDYTVTYGVSNSFGLAAVPVTMNIENWKFIKIDNGQYHGIALGSNGSVWTWGYNSDGQRGVGSGSSANNINGGRPSLINKSSFGGQRMIDIAGAHATSCALAANGQAYCWGDDGSGALGNGGNNNDTDSPSAVAMPSGITFTQISGSHGTSSDSTFGAIGSDGNVYTWGNGSYYRLGNGSTNDTGAPTKITNTGDIVQVSQGNMGGAAVTSSGQVYVWGANGHGQLARGNTTASNASTSLPSIVSGITNVKQVSYGGYSTYGFVVLCRNDGTAYVWGWSYGIRGNSPATDATVPLYVSTVSGVRFVATGADYTHYVSGNDVWAVGYSNYGETFTGTTTRTSATKSSMTNVAGNVGMTSGGYDTAYLLNANGTMVYTIGYNNGTDREFGNPTTATASTGAVVAWAPTITVAEW
jgi:alpha-tubulin suppressor-like RCC1 family protein